MIEIILASFALSVSALTLFKVTRLNDRERYEYDFFVAEHQTKLGFPAGHLAKIKCWNAALGGRAPKYHWIPPVVSTSQGKQRESAIDLGFTEDD